MNNCEFIKKKMEVRVTFFIVCNRKDCDQRKNTSVKFKIKEVVQKNDKSNVNDKANISNSKISVASTDKTDSIILNKNENTKHLLNVNNNKDETSRKLEGSEILNFTIKIQ